MSNEQPETMQEFLDSIDKLTKITFKPGPKYKGPSKRWTNKFSRFMVKQHAVDQAFLCAKTLVAHAVSLDGDMRLIVNTPDGKEYCVSVIRKDAEELLSEEYQDCSCTNGECE